MDDKYLIRIVSLTEAAKLLHELGICKALREGGKINGPNCYRFGHRDTISNKWYWDLSELLRVAWDRRSAPPEVIQRVEERYTRDQSTHLVHNPPNGGEPHIRQIAQPNLPSRAELEKSFRDNVCILEGLLRRGIPAEAGSKDLRTLGSLINESEQRGFFKKLASSEAKLVNTIRNTLFHPDNEDVPDDLLRRGLESAKALIRVLQGKDREIK